MNSDPTTSDEKHVWHQISGFSTPKNELNAKVDKLIKEVERNGRMLEYIMIILKKNEGDLSK